MPDVILTRDKVRILIMHHKSSIGCGTDVFDGFKAHGVSCFPDGIAKPL